MHLFNTTYNSNTIEQAEFAKWLLEIEEDHVPAISENSDTIKLPKDIVLSSQNLNDLIHFVYSDLFIYFDPKYFIERRILTLC